MEWARNCRPRWRSASDVRAKTTRPLVSLSSRWTARQKRDGETANRRETRAGSPFRLLSVSPFPFLTGGQQLRQEIGQSSWQEAAAPRAEFRRFLRMPHGGQPGRFFHHHHLVIAVSNHRHRFPAKRRNGEPSGRTTCGGAPFRPFPVSPVLLFLHGLLNSLSS